jgi:hypothetical protein
VHGFSLVRERKPAPQAWHKAIRHLVEDASYFMTVCRSIALNPSNKQCKVRA